MRRTLLVIVGLATLAGSYFLYQSRPIPAPSGDGEFQDLSGWVGPLPKRGYHIKFPEFDLSLPFSQEYRLSGLSNVGDHCGLYLVMIDSKDEWQWGRDYGKVGGRLALRLAVENGQEVVNVDAPLGEYIWWGWRNKHGLYQTDGRSHFSPDPNAGYILTIDYEPPPEFSAMRGYVYLNTGARYSGSAYR